MRRVEKEYSNGEITILWRAELCQHATFCWQDLIQVFNPKKRPWINPCGADTERIIKQVEKCPSGALTYRNNGEEEEKGMVPVEMPEEPSIEIMKNGPFLLHGNILVKGKDGKKITIDRPITAFCRCGASANKPFCDGKHVTSGFKDE